MIDTIGQVKTQAIEMAAALQCQIDWRHFTKLPIETQALVRTYEAQLRRGGRVAKKGRESGGSFRKWYDTQCEEPDQELINLGDLIRSTVPRVVRIIQAHRKRKTWRLDGAEMLSINKVRDALTLLDEKIVEYAHLSEKESQGE